MTDIRKPADYDAKRDGSALVYFMGDPCFPCHPTGSTWNGFANVRVSPQVRDLIVAAWRETGDDEGPESSIVQMLECQPDADGLIDLSDGWATEIDTDPLGYCDLYGFKAETSHRGFTVMRLSGKGGCVEVSNPSGTEMPSEDNWAIEVWANGDDDEADTDIQCDDDLGEGLPTIADAMRAAVTRLAELETESAR